MLFLKWQIHNNVEIVDLRQTHLNSSQRSVPESVLIYYGPFLSCDIPACGFLSYSLMHFVLTCCLPDLSCRVKSCAFLPRPVNPTWSIIWLWLCLHQPNGDGQPCLQVWLVRTAGRIWTLLCQMWFCTLAKSKKKKLLVAKTGCTDAPPHHRQCWFWTVCW